MICLPALMRSGSSSPSSGKGPTPSIPFSDWRITSIPLGMKFATSVGMPIPRFTYIPSRSSLAARAAICSLVSGMSVAPLADRALLDRLLVGGALHDPLHEDAGRVHLVRVELTG